MPRPPKPWFWEERNSYYVTIKGQRHNLGPDREESERQFHLLMADATRPSPPPAKGGPTVADIFEKYLEWCQIHRAPGTYGWAKGLIQAFCNYLKTARTMLASQLKPFHLSEWVDGKKTWGPTQKRGALIAVQRPFNWAAKLGYLDSNPVRGVEKPKAKRREAYVSPEQFEQILACYREGDPFRDLLTFLWETGCRPQEARHIEVRHLNSPFRRFDIPPEEAKGKKRWRVIRMNDRAWELVSHRLTVSNTKVFENEDGNPWTADAINCRFQRLKRRKGLAHCAYAVRHGFANRKLVEGHDHLTVAELMGHANGNMLASVYQHLGHADDHLKKAL